MRLTAALRAADQRPPPEDEPAHRGGRLGAVEVRGELGEPFGHDAVSTLEGAPARGREAVVHLAPVVLVSLSLDVALRDEAVDDDGDRRVG